MTAAANRNRNRNAWFGCGLGLAAVMCFSGCQVSIGGQTLPSPYFYLDDVQYFPSGPEFILQNEADYIRSQNNPSGDGLEAAKRPGTPPRR